ncbi:hypothetical protein PybrP1_011978 [[Pythium] brassicae (nom. inval.)]|nr:hypothetical protein PybrP1_011978 [[Pythium] brassicae (nom. inval.)]
MRVLLLPVKDADLRTLYKRFSRFDQEARACACYGWQCLHRRDTVCSSAALLLADHRSLRPLQSVDGRTCAAGFAAAGTHSGLNLLSLTDDSSSPLPLKSGTIDRAEFYKSVDEKNSEFGDAIFALIGALACVLLRDVVVVH